MGVVLLMAGDAVTAGQLAAALKEAGLLVMKSDGALIVSHPSRAGMSYLDELITVNGGRAYWSWGQVINGDTVEGVAERIVAIVSLPTTSAIHNSS